MRKPPAADRPPAGPRSPREALLRLTLESRQLRPASGGRWIRQERLAFDEARSALTRISAGRQALPRELEDAGWSRLDGSLLLGPAGPAYLWTERTWGLGRLVLRGPLGSGTSAVISSERPATQLLALARRLNEKGGTIPGHLPLSPGREAGHWWIGGAPQLQFELDHWVVQEGATGEGGLRQRIPDSARAALTARYFPDLGVSWLRIDGPETVLRQG